MYRVRHETNRKVPEPRLPPFNAVEWLTPRRSCSQLHKHTRRLLERPLGVDEARAPVFGRPIAPAARPCRRHCRAAERAELGLLVPRPYGGGGEPPSLDGRAAYRRRARWRPPGRARALATARARASAAASALVIALVRAGARVVLPFAAMVARMLCFFLVSSGTCSVRLVLMKEGCFGCKSQILAFRVAATATFPSTLLSPLSLGHSHTVGGGESGHELGNGSYPGLFFTHRPPSLSMPPPTSCGPILLLLAVLPALPREGQPSATHFSCLTQRMRSSLPCAFVQLLPPTSGSLSHSRPASVRPLRR